MESVKLAVKIVPGARKTEIVGWLGTALKIRIAAPPVKGKANKSVEMLLAKELGIDKRSIAIVRGHSSAHKQIEISGLSNNAIERRFGSPLKY